MLPKDKLNEKQKAQTAIQLSREGFRLGYGGPFGALIVDRKTDRIWSAGVNMVLSKNQCIAHAEIVAIVNAQHKLNNYDFNAAGGDFELITSCEPCAMCYGAIIWSGISRLVCCACTKDAEDVGFDEGNKPDDWDFQLCRRGIEVEQRVCRPEAWAVLREYEKSQGTIY